MDYSARIGDPELVGIDELYKHEQAYHFQPGKLSQQPSRPLLHRMELNGAVVTPGLKPRDGNLCDCSRLNGRKTRRIQNGFTRYRFHGFVPLSQDLFLSQWYRSTNSSLNTTLK